MRARITTTFEYDINPENYASCSTPEDMLALDLGQLTDPFLLAEMMEFNGETVKISGEVLA